MKSFFKYVLATITGIVISFVVLFIVLMGIIGAIISSASSDQEIVVKSNSVLYLSFDYDITERSEANPLGSLNLPGYSTKNIGLDDILARIKYAATDGNIKGIYLDASHIGVGFASLKEVRDELLAFKKTGKFVVAYNAGYDQKAYYVASTADKVYVNPQGTIDFRGLASSTMFYKDLLDKVGVEMQIVKVGTFKSAVEPYFLNKMSDPNRLQVTSYLGSIYGTFINEIAASRNIAADSLRAIANDYRVRDADDAVKYKLADAKLYKDELLSDLRKRLKISEKDEISFVSLLDYNKKVKDDASGSEVAVLYAAGEIVDGEGTGPGQIGGDKFSRELRKLREDDAVKAVVLRVNSPGGSALASDIIWREVILTKKVKPVIVSMGDLAASGGYYISAAADSIFAEPTTITGSIGVFGVIPNFQNLMNNKIGVHYDGVKTGKFADLMTSFDRPLTAEERDIIQREVNKVYGTFTKVVADGRKLSIADVDSIGQGRVWTGAQGVNNKLVDRLGNLDAAIQAAAKKANLSKYKVSQYPEKEDPFTSILNNSKEKVQVWVAKEQMGEYYRYFDVMRKATAQTGVQARLPYSVEIH
ncbi:MULTISPECIES: signal peptide peptidase SppA [Sphingobacterium]|uniref:Signal peptide peptidase SppA n=1 Tax=Sphingobacterium paramultivorum TaxID=2886510 RepID=A0A7G5E3C1_9SPHI|nr:MULTISPECIES: signal peptide peptidase SppA [Sphingobacterium]MBB1642361.1 signal peptide peptidase SppA [Sphingobacterium sp. UME9]MCS4165991.1 protease-4 [Sphingobacterium sp. BIGb0116]QMV68496.1 signal peptide peptidase SppA [Sphingobacterium paramultivorum]WET69449.1 MAG: signal peptide peptidase SppA [Sphingobacterium sp.]WSO17437.1 signal peptide peptidase SppA [Sphingobacterium paramultivorum]